MSDIWNSESKLLGFVLSLTATQSPALRPFFFIYMRVIKRKLVIFDMFQYSTILQHADEI